MTIIGHTHGQRDILYKPVFWDRSSLIHVNSSKTGSRKKLITILSSVEAEENKKKGSIMQSHLPTFIN